MWAIESKKKKNQGKFAQFLQLKSEIYKKKEFKLLWKAFKQHRIGLKAHFIHSIISPKESQWEENDLRKRTGSPTSNLNAKKKKPSTTINYSHGKEKNVSLIERWQRMSKMMTNPVNDEVINSFEMPPPTHVGINRVWSGLQSQKRWKTFLSRVGTKKVASDSTWETNLVPDFRW